MKSFRLQFVDIDSSYSISTAVATIKGFIVARAPKGQTEAMYFEPANTKYIEAMVGCPTADWPDLFEAEAFNNEYGLYISAPAGTSKEYPSYYGGVYLTKNGLQQFWHVTDRENPNFEVAATAGRDSAVNPAYSDSKFEIIATKGNKISDKIEFKISNISAAEMGKMSYFNVSYVGKTYEFHISGNSIYFVKNGVDYIKKGSETPTEVGTVSMNAGKYTINISIPGGDSKLPDFSINKIKAISKLLEAKNDIDINNLYVNDDAQVLIRKNTSLSDSSKNGDVYFNASALTLEVYNGTEIIKLNVGDAILDTDFYWKGKYSKDAEYIDGDIVYENADIKLHDSAEASGWKTIPANGRIELSPSASTFDNLLRYGVSTETQLRVKGADTTYMIKPFAGLYDAVTFRLNIKDETFLAISQKSPNETPTHLTISDIGYDKYLYDVNVPVISKKFLDEMLDLTEEDDDGNPIRTVTVSDNFKSELATLNVDNVFAVASFEDDADTVDASLALYKLDYDAENDKDTLTDVTKEYVTKDFYIAKAMKSDSYSSAVVRSLQYTIWYIEEAGEEDEFSHEIIIETADGDSGKQLRGNALFDTVTFSCKEEVNLGSYTDGGEFTGSMEETGKDAAGTEIYFPSILADDSVTFVNVQVVNTLSDLGLVNAEGFWTGTKIVDPKGPAVDSYSFSVVGQRYANKVMRDNLAEGKNGGVWRDDYAQIIKDGLVEANNLIYDDALVFMEPTGEEQFKAQLAALRASHDTSTIISPKNLTQAQFEKPDTIPVAGRCTGTAQYIGEFRMKDPTTKKYYYCKPIGDVGLMLARIMDKKLGGVAPAGTNDSQNCGGQLARAVISAKWNFVDSQLKTFDEKGLNAITYDAENGLMIQAHKTTQDPSNVTDWSFLAHSMAFDLCKREIRDKVMTPQLFKKINSYWMSIRQTQVEDILAKRTTGNDPIWDSATCDISGVNTDQTKLKRQFVMKVTVRVNRTSESVLLMFENIA